MDNDNFWGKFLRKMVLNYRQNRRMYFLLNTILLIGLCCLQLFVDRNYYSYEVIIFSWAIAFTGITLQFAATGLTIWVRRSGNSFIDNAGNAYHKATKYLEKLGFDEFKKNYKEFIFQGIVGLVSWLVIVFFLAKWSIPYMIAVTAVSLLLISIPHWLRTSG